MRWFRVLRWDTSPVNMHAGRGAAAEAGGHGAEVMDERGRASSGVSHSGTKGFMGCNMEDSKGAENRM